MAIKHILLPLTGQTRSANAALCALRLAKAMKAHVSAGYEDELGPLYMPTIGYIASGPTFGAFYEQMQRTRAERKALARGFFDRAVADTQLPIVNAPLCTQGSAMWIDDADTTPLARHGVFSDLAVLEMPGDEASPVIWNVAEECLFKVKRPLLTVPPDAGSVDFARPVIAWNGSTQAMNAVRAVLPLLPAQAVATILQVGDLKRGGLPASGLADYLGWHCFETRTVLTDDRPRGTGRAILDAARAAGGTCIVMGAFTRSPTRELLFGGVTDFMLRAATLPVLLAH